MSIKIAVAVLLVLSGAAIFTHQSAPPEMPTHVFVNGSDWSIVISRNYGLWGKTKFDTSEIYVEPQTTPAMQRRILVHELMHVCQHDAELMVHSKPKTDEEKAEQLLFGTPATQMTADEWIEATSPNFLQMLKDNPQLVAYLTAK